MEGDFLPEILEQNAVEVTHCEPKGNNLFKKSCLQIWYKLNQSCSWGWIKLNKLFLQEQLLPILWVAIWFKFLAGIHKYPQPQYAYF